MPSARRRRLNRSRQKLQRPRPHPGQRAGTALRWVAGLMTLVAAIAVTVWANKWARLVYDAPSTAASFWHNAKDGLREDGYGIVVFCLAAVVVGAVLHAPVALLRRAQVGKGLLAALGLVVYVLAVAALATLVASSAPDFQPGSGRGDPGGLYGAALVCLLGGPVLLTIGGGVFVPRQTDFSLAARLLATGLIGGLTGVACLAVVGVAIALRTPAVRVWVPPSGGAFLVIGAIAAGGMAVLAIAAAASLWLDGGLPAKAMHDRGAGALGLAAVAAYFAVTALVGAQVGRLLPGWLVSLTALAWLFASGPAMGWFFARRAKMTSERARPQGSSGP